MDTDPDIVLIKARARKFVEDNKKNPQEKDFLWAETLAVIGASTQMEIFTKQIRETNIPEEIFTDKVFVVADTPFNRAHYKDIVGLYFEIPPSYAAMDEVERPKDKRVFHNVTEYRKTLDRCER